MTFMSSSVVIFPEILPVQTSSFKSLRMILPDRVFGSAGAKWRSSGLAMAPITFPT